MDCFGVQVEVLVEQAENTTSPLILDLDGDGVETLGQDFYIHFDHDKNGFAERTGWVGADDGLLVLDRNGNGQIDNGGELFGNNSGTGPGPANGFVALAEFDQDGNGSITASDTAFASLRVWKDVTSRTPSPRQGGQAGRLSFRRGGPFPATALASPVRSPKSGVGIF
jgi:hypothetical protein